MSRPLRLVTLGSARQSTELTAAARSRGHVVESVHIVEDSAEWTVRHEELLRHELRDGVASFDGEPDALINFGRATVPGGIPLIAQLMEEVVAEGVVPRTTKLVGPSAHAASVWENKSEIVRHLSRLSVPTPRTLVICVTPTSDEVRAVQQAGLAYPLVVKAPRLTGGIGMRFADTPASLKLAVEQLSRISTELVIGEFVEGDEVSVDLLRLGKETLVFPPGYKCSTDPALTHADHKIKVNGVVRDVPEFTRDMRAIAEDFNLQGFFSLEAVIAKDHRTVWRVLEGATRLTNNVQLQDASLNLDCLGMVADYAASRPWYPSREILSLALSIPIYEHRGEDSVTAVQRMPGVRQVKLENLAAMPDSRDDRVRLTVKLQARELEKQLLGIADVTGDESLPRRVINEVDRVRRTYA